MWLMVDDLREGVGGVDAIARTPEAAKALIGLKIWDGISFDHDLGLDETGYDLMKWSIKRNLLPKNISLITSNPVGRDNMKSILLSKGYTTLNNVDFRKD